MTADIIAHPVTDLITDPTTIVGIHGETIGEQAAAGLVCIEIYDYGTVVDVFLTIPALDNLIANLIRMRADAVRVVSPSPRKPSVWAAPAAQVKAYADRLDAARRAFQALNTDTQSRVSVLLERMGTPAAPCGTTQFAGIVQMLGGHNIREADQLFAADLRAIGRAG